MKTISTVIFCLGSVVLASGAEQALHPFSGTNAVTLTPALINLLAEEARTNNPSLRAADARAKAASWNIDAVRTWEDPMVKFGGVTASPRGPMLNEEGDLIYGLEQKLPLFGKPQLARRVAEAGAAAEGANVNYQFQLLRRELAKQLFKIALADRVVEIGTQDLTWLDSTVESVEQRYRIGKATLVELLRVQNERAKRSDQLRSDVTRRDHERLALNRILNRELHTHWPAMELPPLATPVNYSEKLVNFAIKYEPKVKLMQQEIKQAEAVTHLTRRQRLPDVSVGIEGRQFSGDGGFREGMFTVSLNLPWGNAKKYRSDQQRDAARLKATELDLADYELTVREDVHHLTVAIDAARREGLLYRDEIVPRAEQALASARFAWETDKGLLNDVLEARRMTLEGRLMFARAVAEQYQAMSELVLCCGLGDLEALQMLDVQTDPIPPQNKAP